jgi:hypothetical protein
VAPSTAAAMVPSVIELRMVCLVSAREGRLCPGLWSGLAFEAKV